MRLDPMQALADPVRGVRRYPGWNRLLLILGLMWLLQLAESQGLTRRLAEVHDEVVRLSALAGAPIEARHVVAVAIDEHDYRDLYRQTSPLDPRRIAGLVQDVARANPSAVVIDLDLSPIDAADADLRASTIDAALLTVARDRPVVLVCPQSASMPGGMGTIERGWVARLAAGGLRFARAEVHAGALHLNLADDGVAMALRDAVRRDPADVGVAAASAALCDPTADRTSVAARSEPVVLVPSAVPHVASRDVPSLATIMAGRVVVIGGTFGSGDTFAVRGVGAPLHGLTVHAWQIEQLLAGAASPPASEPRFLARLAIAWVYATLLAWAWRQIVDPRLGTTGRFVASSLMVAFVVAGPLLAVTASAVAARQGVPLGLSGLLAGVLVSAVIAAPLQLYASSGRLPEPRDPRWLQVHGWLAVFGTGAVQRLDRVVGMAWRWSLLAASTATLSLGLAPWVAATWCVAVVGFAMAGRPDEARVGPRAAASDG